MTSCRTGYHRTRAASRRSPQRNVQQAQHFKAPFPARRPVLIGVEELGGDLAAGQLGQAASAGELPIIRRLRVLLALGRQSSVEGEPSCLSSQAGLGR